MKTDMDKDLKKLFPKDQLLISPEEKITYSYDATNQRFLPDAIVLVRST